MKENRPLKNADKPAFACSDGGNETTTTWQGQDGLTKREYFAAMAMQGLIGMIDRYESGEAVSGLCFDAVAYADELLRQLES